jgi:hypothetical protein
VRQTIYWYLYRYAPPGSVLEHWAFKKWMSTGWQRPIDKPTEDTTSYEPRTQR